MKSSGFNVICIVGILVSFMAGCIAWEPGWKQAQAPAVKGDVKALIGKAKKLESEADSREKLSQLITALEDVLKADPRNQQALQDLGSYCYLMGYGYGNDKGEKVENYRKALQYCERSMYRDPDFKALVDKGEEVWNACRVLKKDNMRAIYFYYMAAGNWWVECLGPLEKMVSFFWIGRGKKLLEYMTAIDPQWGYGRVYFAWACLYTVSPGFLGGDMKKADEYFNKALALGPHMNVFYGTRARYYQVKMKDRKAFSGDLHHALAIDPRKMDEYPWAVWYHVKSVEMLKDIDKYFK